MPARLRFQPGVHTGQTATITGDDNEPAFTYRGFASIVPLIAMVVAVIVGATGLATVAFLIAEGRPVPAAIALVLGASFAVLIAMLVPQTNVTLFRGTSPMITIAQQSNVSFPVVTYIVATPDHKIIARLRRSDLSRLGRNRWKILPPESDRPIGVAVEESLSRALMRKVAGKFDPRYQSDILITYLGKPAGWIVRRPNEAAERDYLEVTGDIDPRVAIALATLVFGSEP